MVRWRMEQLRHRYEETTGRALTASDLLREAGLSTSTAYLVMADEPKRIGLKSIDALLTFFSRHLGQLETSDLIEFEFEDSAES